MTTRPVGHITELMGRLEKWRQRREAKQLETATLKTTLAYLEEYRELTIEFEELRFRMRGLEK